MGWFKLGFIGEMQCRKAVNQLPKVLRTKVLSKAARIAMKPVLKTAKANAPKETGKLRKTIKLRSIKRNRQGNVGVFVASSKKWYVGNSDNSDAYYGAFVEFGHYVGKRSGRTPSLNDRISKFTGRKFKTGRSFVKGIHFVERAYKQHRTSARTAFINEVKAGVARINTGGKV